MTHEEYSLVRDLSFSIGNFMVVVCAGIMNHEEYSLVRDLSDDEKEKTLTLKRDRSIAKDQKKLDEMKRKLHTDDECKTRMRTLLTLLTY